MTLHVTQETPLAVAKDQLRAELMAGECVECPVCTQTAKIYKRTVYATIARNLIALYRAGGDAEGWLHLPTVLGSNDGGTATLAHWGLLEELTEKREDGGRAGWWRLTEYGRAFVRGEARVPKYVHLYDGRVLQHSGDPVGIRECLGDRFDYAELMSR